MIARSERSDPDTKPVVFHYKRDVDPHGVLWFGLVAEEVEAINPDLMVQILRANCNGPLRRCEHDAAERVSESAS